MDRGPEFEFGNVIGQTFSVWFRNLIPVSILQAVAFLPLFLYTFVVLSGTPTLDSLHIWQYVSLALTIPLSLLATAGVTFGVVRHLQGRPAGIGASIVVGVSRLLPVLGVGLLMTLCILGGFVLLIVPGIIVSCMLWVAMPVAVIEKPGIVAALKRSRYLTDGYKAAIFGVMFVLSLIQNLIGLVLQHVILGTPETLGEAKMHVWIIFLVQVVVIGSLNSVASAVGYHDLRAKKEGTGIEELAKVFD